jgi:transcriptional regulator with XRE-family HTH domain
LPASGRPTVRRRELGILLKELRIRHGLTVEDVARHLECSPSKVSRLETGQRGADRRDVASLCDLYQVDEALREKLVKLAEQSRQRLRLAGLPYKTYADMEAGAVAVRDFGLSLVPGLLQTADYAEAVLRFASPNDPASVIQQQVSGRMERQQLLHRANPPAFEAILDESILHRVVGSRAVMHEQLIYLAEVTQQRQDLSLRVLRFSAGVAPATVNKFILLSFTDRDVPDLVYVEVHPQEELFLDKPIYIRTYWQAFETMRAKAADEDASRQLILSIASSLSR